jgi:hypothetical protein
MAYGVNSPWGLQPVRYMNGAAWNDQVTPYRLPSGYNVNLFRQDPATAAANGFVQIATTGHGGTNQILLGSFTSFQWVDVNGVTQFSDTWTAGTVTLNAQDAVAFIADDPMIVFNMQAANTGTTTIISANLLRNADIVGQGQNAGNTYSDLSGWGIDQTTIGTDATRQVKIIRFVPTPDGTNVSGLVFNNVECIINNHYYRVGQTSI